jgi:hypothetical protein
MTSKQKEILTALDNDQMDYFFQKVLKLPHYVPCVTKDELYKLPVKRCFTIINSANSSDPTDEKGVSRHWNMIYLLDLDYAIFFDSYGSLMAEATEYYIHKAAKKFHQEIIYSDSELQTIGSSSCGWYCIFVILHLLMGYTLHEILEMFDEKHISYNERFLYEWFKLTQIKGKSLLEWLSTER